jgi:hypothetical protein
MVPRDIFMRIKKKAENTGWRPRRNNSRNTSIPESSRGFAEAQRQQQQQIIQNQIRGYVSRSLNENRNAISRVMQISERLSESISNGQRRTFDFQDLGFYMKIQLNPTPPYLVDHFDIIWKHPSGNTESTPVHIRASYFDHILTSNTFLRRPTRRQNIFNGLWLVDNIETQVPGTRASAESMTRSVLKASGFKIMEQSNLSRATTINEQVQLLQQSMMRNRVQSQLRRARNNTFNITRSRSRSRNGYSRPTPMNITLRPQSQLRRTRNHTLNMTRSRSRSRNGSSRPSHNSVIQNQLFTVVTQTSRENLGRSVWYRTKQVLEKLRQFITNNNASARITTQSFKIQVPRQGIPNRNAFTVRNARKTLTSYSNVSSLLNEMETNLPPNIVRNLKNTESTQRRTVRVRLTFTIGGKIFENASVFISTNNMQIDTGIFTRV